MTYSSGQPAAGWYPDPHGGASLRWWDGARWTEHTSTPPAPQYAAPASLYAEPDRLEPGAGLYSPWIWIAAVLPIVGPSLLFLALPSGNLRHLLATATPRPGDVFALMSGPALLATSLVSWLAIAFAVVCAWLDYRWLQQRGMRRPFPWAFAFIGVVFNPLGHLVYVIGRSVVVRRAAGGRGGLAPIWVAVAAQILALVLGGIWLAVFLTTFLSGNLGDLSGTTISGA
ncbi:DUF2510 domain-containing protein [Leifsonia sp. AG29]|uniref:DUF2510 domain-containing protein n=1 Tax=Leifsonia sp. AG29 TaxID=2598860 RepID=UPI00131DA1EB|nr:DUF2510 domain-containing protein [Leifsonia sp. AG29]